MILTKQQITILKKQYKKAKNAEQIATAEKHRLASLISDITGVEGECEHLAGDGFGFAPLPKFDYIPLDELITLTEKGHDITKELILSYTCI